MLVEAHREQGVEHFLGSLRQKSMNEAREELLKFMGVGHKVADCVLLMSLDKVQWFSEHCGFSRICTDIVSQ